MAEQTYAIASLRDFRPGAQEIPFNNVAGHPYLQDQGAALAIFNRTGSGRIVKITDWFIKDMSTPNSIAASRFLVQLVTGWTLGGAEWKYETTKWDSNNADLPSQVNCWEDVQAVTGGITLRTVLNLPLYNETRALSEMCSLLHADKDSGLNNSSIFRAFNVTGGVQPIIVREGQGVCITPDGGLVQQTIKYALNFFFRDAATGQCYMCNCNITPDGERTAFLFTNEAGSGKTYEVYNVELAETGNDTFLGCFSLEKIESLDPDSGLISDLYSHDSANESLSGLVDYRRDCNVTIYGLSKGAIMARPILGRDYQTSQGGAPYLNGSMPLAFGARNANFGDLRKPSSAIVLREGEGAAIFKRHMNGIGKSSLFIRFTVENAATGGEVVAGATDYAYLG